MVKIDSDWLEQHSGMAWLYWVSSPQLSKVNTAQRLVRCAFVSGDDYKIIERPWGELPLLQPGYVYSNCFLSKPLQDLQHFRFDSSDITRSFVQPALQCIQQTLHPLAKYSPSFLNDNCLVCIVQDISYVIPCTEVIRAIAGTSSFFIELLLSASSLMNYAQIFIGKDKIHIYPYEGFNKYPSNMRSDQQIFEFANFTCNSVMRNWWDSVQSDFLSKSDKNLIHPISAVFPNDNSFSVRGLGKRLYNTVLLLHIDIDHLPTIEKPIAFITPEKHMSSNNSARTNKRTLLQSNPDEIILSDSDSAKKSTITFDMAINPERYAFPPKIAQLHYKANHSDFIEPTTAILTENPVCAASMSDSLPGGTLPKADISPAFLPSNDPITIEKRAGFSLFTEAIRVLTKSRRMRIIHIAFNNTPAEYAIVTIQRGENQYLIIEFSDRIPPVSTLIAGPLSPNRDLHQIEQDLLRSWSKNNKHWAN